MLLLLLLLHFEFLFVLFVLIFFLLWYFIPRVLKLAKAKMYVRNGYDGDLFY